MIGFKALDSAKSTIAGIELHHILRKGQYIMQLINPFSSNFMR